MTGITRPTNTFKAAEPGAHAAEQAERCRRLSKSTSDRKTSEMLILMAEDYDRQAKAAG
ncbi:hypothetical protein H9L13_07925 [Sphingomonas lutea]|uniref:Uncharacterized protein n=1 Tax=Sphingomonas lutea TaxID=1045317 RepID=A0A7G9SFK5_9SPHN|nr:hypothetical protein [Sphingomonas lutea]QNN66630.1 hypothetical protein H9L13_07925 [Sphingomonas lutea]